MIDLHTLGPEFHRLDIGNRSIWFRYGQPISFTTKSGKVRTSENIHGELAEKDYSSLTDYLFRIDRYNFLVLLEDEFGNA